MAKSNLEKAIEQAVEGFALEIVQAIKASTLQELVALQGDAPKKVGKKPGRKPKEATAKAAAKPAKKKRVVKNYPKCAYPKCNRNRFVRGKGFCGVHWKEWLAGKIKDADHYKKKGK